MALSAMEDMLGEALYARNRDGEYELAPTDAVLTTRNIGILFSANVRHARRLAGLENPPCWPVSIRSVTLHCAAPFFFFLFPFTQWCQACARFLPNMLAAYQGIVDRSDVEVRPSRCGIALGFGRRPYEWNSATSTHTFVSHCRLLPTHTADRLYINV
jgi:hypothetical protein